MSDEDAFIRALRERPDDETARLVYTDWLDDRSDPRAEYLRAEAAWVALQPSDEQYRPLYRRISQLAAGLDPEWFATVSRMGYLVRQAWEPLSSTYGSAMPAAGQPEAWGEATTELRTILDEIFDSERLERHFCAPVDFVAFMCVVGDTNWNYTPFQLSTAAEDLVVEASDFVEPSTGERELWVQFANASDSSWHCVCYDLESPIFGVVSETMGELWRPGGDTHAYFCGRNVLEFLSGYLPTFLKAGAPPWSDMPRAKWATH